MPPEGDEEVMFWPWRKKKAPVSEIIWSPKTDLELLNNKECPDCGGTEWTECEPGRKSRIECTGCGSAFAVSPCSGPPFEYADHIGYNRQGRIAQIKYERKS